MTTDSRLTRSRFLIGSLGALSAGSLLGRPVLAAANNVLDRYVAAPDPAYRVRVLSEPLGEGHSTFVLEMISQRWRGKDEVDRTEWRHWLTIVVPPVVATDVVALVIGGGSNGDEPPEGVSSFLVRAARTLQAVVAEVRMVPNQPLQFAGEEQGRGEDELVAYSWDKFLRTGDEFWPLRLPMTKSVVRAMDAITAFCAADGRGITVGRFIVGGASKRGWTAWTTAAVDKRVAAVVPVVIDTLNVEASAQHEYAVYGTWPPSLRAYEQLGIMRWLGTPQMNALMQIEDPYAYRERLTMPKFIVNATGDEFYVPDSSQYYFGALPDDKYLRYVPNSDHSLKNHTAGTADDVIAFCRSVIHQTARPQCTWKIDDDAILVHSATPPSHVTLWQAANGSARDFRLATIGKAFRGTPLRDQGGGTYVGAVPAPRAGWNASFVELAYPTTEGTFTMTTGVRVTPDVLPFALPGQGT